MSKSVQLRPATASDEDIGALLALKPPPHNYEAERALLGAILMDNRSFDRVATFLHHTHFADPVNGRVFLACQKMIDLGTQANPVTLKPYLERDPLVADAGGIKYLASLAGSAVTVVNAGDYGKLIHDLYLRRVLIAAAYDLSVMAYSNDVEDLQSATSLIEEGITALADMLEGTGTSDALTHVAATIDDAMKRQEAVDRGEISGLSSGLPSLDDAMGMMENGDLIVIAGRPSMGKSALAQTILYHTAGHFAAEARRTGGRPKHAVFFSQEMTNQANADRLVSAMTNIPAPRHRRTPLTEGQWAKLVAFRATVADLPLMIDATSRATFGRIRARCRRLQRAGGVGLVVVDYLQIMGIDRGKKTENRTQEVGHLATGLKDLAKELNCPVIALSQLNRGVEQREDKRPNLSDLRESGEIEQAADIVGFCYRDEYYLERSEPKTRPDESSQRFMERFTAWEAMRATAAGRAEIIMAKVRHGHTGTANLEFDGARTWFEDPGMSRSTPPPWQGSVGRMPDGRPVPPDNTI